MVSLLLNLQMQMALHFSLDHSSSLVLTPLANPLFNARIVQLVVTVALLATLLKSATKSMVIHLDISSRTSLHLVLHIK